MKSLARFAVLAATMMLLPTAEALGHMGPFDGKDFNGRIAYSADGNHNDPDDWASSPVALAIIARFGFQDRLVHFDYNCILPNNNPLWRKIHATAVLGAVEHYGYDLSVFYDCQKDADAAINSIAHAINASSADDPLYFIVAGPMEVPYLGIQKSDPAKRKFVYCISHSSWNDGFARDYTFTHTKRSVISSGVKWIQIPDQNRQLATSRYGIPAKPEEYAPFFWMRDSSDPRVHFLWERMVISTRPDCSDAGMAYFLTTGDEQVEITGLRRLLDDSIVPKPADPRPRVRIEAENFLALDQFELEYRDDRAASHRVNVKLADASSGHIMTRFDEPYTAPQGVYDVNVRYFDEEEGQCQFVLSVNDRQQGSAWKSPGRGQGWTTHTVSDATVNEGDEIRVVVEGEIGRLDYVQLNFQTSVTK